MTKYRDFLLKEYGEEMASVVGCGLDRLKRDVSVIEIKMALEFYTKYRAKIDNLEIGGRRQIIQEFIESNGRVPESLAM